jgi:single-strand DNA-binding protein
MASFNKVILLGNLTRDPELKHVAGNQAVAELGLAINRRYRTKDNEEREEVTYVDCEAWGRTAEVLKQYLTKGSPIFIEGRLKLDQWESKEGEKRSKIRVVIENFQFVGSRGEGSGTGGGGGGGFARSGRGASGGSSGGGDHVPLPSDDIPF